jgi:hypothetical protein
MADQIIKVTSVKKLYTLVILIGQFSIVSIKRYKKVYNDKFLIAWYEQ